MAGVELLSDQGFRIDGRKPGELRKMSCKMDVFQQADGSAYLEQGNTKVLATVYGPHEIRGSRSKVIIDKALINCQYSMATFSTGERKKRPKGDRRSQEMTLNLKKAFEAAVMTSLYPRSQIDIYVQVLQSDGGNYSACVNATTLAMIDAGVAMRDFVCACSASLVDNTPILDINYLEESHGGSEVTVAILPKSDQIAMFQVQDRLHVDSLEKVMDTAMKGCHHIYTVLNKRVQDHVTRMSATMLAT